MEGSRLRWSERRDGDDVGKMMLKLEIPGQRSRRRPKKRFMDVKTKR